MRVYKKFVDLKEGDTLYEIILEKEIHYKEHIVKYIAKKGKKTLSIRTDNTIFTFNPNNFLSFFHYMKDSSDGFNKIIMSDYQGTIDEFKRKIATDKKILNALNSCF